MDDQKFGNHLNIGGVNVPGRVWLAPMTGVTDLPFRQVAAGLGAAYVATEMVACEQFVAARPEVVRRAAVGEGLPLMVLQLAGGETDAVAKGARLATEAGAQIIDLNFGCPAKTITGIACGSAIMRDLDRAERLISAAVGATDVAVTVKMRLGWDDAARNAPELAIRAQDAGARAVTVHGRTRHQFYTGVADWRAVAEVKAAVSIPVIINGDIVNLDAARQAVAQSGADGVMIGRGALGRPWIATHLEAALEGRHVDEPGPVERARIVIGHLDASVRFYGERLGLRMFRKHLAAYVDAAPWPVAAQARRNARARLCQLETACEIAAALCALWLDQPDRIAA